MRVAAGRRFALSLAFGFSVLTTILAWRRHSSFAVVTAGVALLVLLAGVVAPGRLEPFERRWRRLGELMSRVTSPIVFGALYFLVVTPAGLLRRTLGRSPLKKNPAAGTFWADRDDETARSPADDLEHQF